MKTNITDQENILLIIDDEEDVRILLKSIFEKDFIVLDAADGLTGKELALEHLPNIIICDIMMPAMDGFEFCKFLKNDEKTSHIPIILLTAKTDIESKIEGLQLGATDYITKPFLVEELKVKMNNLITMQLNNFKYLSNKILNNKVDDILFYDDGKNNLGAKLEEPFLEKVNHVISSNYMNQTFDIDSFARALFLSPVQLRRKLKAITNYTIVEFIRKFRLLKAEKLLVESELNITEIAYQVGFDSIFYFSKVFQDQYNMPPTEFRMKQK